MVLKPIQWNVSSNGVLKGIFWATKKLRFSIDRPGMNRRGLSEALDDKIMGDIATIAVLEYLDSMGVVAIAYDNIRNDNYKKPDPGWDIAIGKEALIWGQTTTSPIFPNGLTTASIKSSRLPRNDTLRRAIETRDFKIFNYSTKIENDIKTDIEVQVYYDYQTTQLGNQKVTQEDVDICRNTTIINNLACENIRKKLDITTRWSKCYIVGFNDKASIIQYSYKLEKKTWSSYGKEMWFAPLREGLSIAEISRYNI